MSKSNIITRRPKLKSRLGQEGIALLLTLLVTVILSVVVLEFNYLMRVHATLSGNLIDDLRAEAAAAAGVETARAVLLNDLVADSEKEIMSDTLEEEWAEEINVETRSSKTVTTILDEMSKLNLNRLVERASIDYDLQNTNMFMVENVRRLFESIELDPDLVEKIVDWIDEDDEEQSFGAESSYYESLSPPVRCKNGPLDSVEELLLMEGFDKGILYGDDETPGLAEFVTVCGDEKGLVNINTAPEEVIAAVVNSGSVASMIIDMREEAPFENAEDMATRVPDAKLSNKFTTWSTFFLVSSTGRTFPAGSPAQGPPTREVRLKALLKRVQSREDTGENYFGIETVFFKAGR
jgi:general secretion pathway protein K